MKWSRTEKRTETKEKTVIILSKWVYFPFVLGGYTSTFLGMVGVLYYPPWLSFLVAVWFCVAFLLNLSGVEAR